MPRRTSKTRRGEQVQAPAWDLSDLYAGPEDPALLRGLGRAEKAAAAFAKRYRGRLGGALSARQLRKILGEYERILESIGRAGAYAFLRYAEAPGDHERGALYQKVTSRVTAVSQELLFLDLELARIGPQRLRRLVADRQLTRYRHHLEKVLAYAPHRLSEAEERLLQERNLTGEHAFTRLFDTEHAGKRYTVKTGRTSREVSGTAAIDLLFEPDRRVRQAAAAGFSAGLEEMGQRSAFIFNTLLEDKRVVDRYRRYSTPEASRHLSNEIDAAMVDTMVTVVVESYPLVQDFYRFKRELLGVRKLYSYDRLAPVGVGTRQWSWRQARDIVLTAFERFSPRYAAVAAEFFERNWIDAGSRSTKRGGAFCHPVTPGVHPWVLMNYAGGFRDVLTLAHELGHAIHFRLMAKHGYLNMDVPLTIAETASVFSEMLVFDYLRSTITDPAELLPLLVGKIENIFNTIFRQVAFYRFEQDIHAARVLGELSPAQFNSCWLERQREMFGSSLEFAPGYDWWWSYISHFVHSPFYVYAYAFGELLTLALYEQHREGVPGFTERYLKLLSAGGTAAPAELLQPLGINLTEWSFWEGGIEIIAGMVREAHRVERQPRAR